jgi:hypothetical protein
MISTYERFAWAAVVLVFALSYLDSTMSMSKLSAQLDKAQHHTDKFARTLFVAVEAASDAPSNLTVLPGDGDHNPALDVAELLIPGYMQVFQLARAGNIELSTLRNEGYKKGLPSYAFPGCLPDLTTYRSFLHDIARCSRHESVVVLDPYFLYRAWDPSRVNVNTF